MGLWHQWLPGLHRLLLGDRVLRIQSFVPGPTDIILLIYTALLTPSKTLADNVWNTRLFRLLRIQ